LASVISLDEAGRRTGLTKRQIGDLIADRKLAIERDPVTGEKGIYPHTLRGINGYQPPEPAPRPKPTSPPPPEPEPWAPDAVELAAMIRLDKPGRDAAMADLLRRHPEARAYFQENPLPPVFRKPAPPPPPPLREPQWDPPPEPPPRRPEPIYREPPPPPKQTPKPPLRPIPDTQPAAPVSLVWLVTDMTGEILLALRKAASRLQAHASQSHRRVAVAGVILLAGWLLFPRPTPRPWLPAPAVVAFRPLPSRQTVRPVNRHHALPAVQHTPRPTLPKPPPYSLPSLRPPGADRPNLKTHTDSGHTD
jgi:hypothetical protein